MIILGVTLSLGNVLNAVFCCLMMWTLEEHGLYICGPENVDTITYPDFNHVPGGLDFLGRVRRIPFPSPQ